MVASVQTIVSPKHFIMIMVKGRKFIQYVFNDPSFWFACVTTSMPLILVKCITWACYNIIIAIIHDVDIITTVKAHPIQGWKLEEEK